MTAARRPRSAALLVGSTSATSANVHSAGQSFKRFFASARTCRCRLPVEPHSRSGHLCFLISPTRWRRTVRSPSLLELLPGLEDAMRSLLSCRDGLRYVLERQTGAAGRLAHIVGAGGVVE